MGFIDTLEALLPYVAGLGLIAGSLAMGFYRKIQSEIQTEVQRQALQLPDGVDSLDDLLRAHQELKEVVQEQAERYGADRVELRNKIRGLEEKLTLASARLQDKDDAISGLQTANNTMLKTIDSMSKRLEATEKELVTIREAYQQKDAELNERDKAIRELETEVKMHRASLKVMESALSRPLRLEITANGLREVFSVDKDEATDAPKPAPAKPKPKSIGETADD